MQNTEVLSILSMSFRRLFWRFRRNPFEFLYEDELRAALYADLRHDMDVHLDLREEYTEFIRKTHPGSKRLLATAGTRLCTPMVKAEYPRYGSDTAQQRFDIAIVKQDLSHENVQDIWALPVSVAVELKMGSEQIGSDKFGGFISDYKGKIRHTGRQRQGKGFVGIAAYFYQGCDMGADKYNEWLPNHGDISLSQKSIEELTFAENHTYAVLLPVAHGDELVSGNDVYVYSEECPREKGKP